MGRGEGSFLPSGAHDVGDIRNLLDITPKLEVLFEGTDGLDRALRLHPSAVTLVHIEDLGWKWIDFPALARRARLLPAAFRLFRPYKIEEAFAIFHDESIQVDQCADTVRDLVGDSGDYPTRIGVAAENHVVRFFPADEIDDISDMGGKIDRRRCEVAPIAYSGKCGRENVVTCGSERPTYSLPAPAPVP